MINYAFKLLVKSLPRPGKCHSESQWLCVHIQIGSSNASDVEFPVALVERRHKCVCQQTSPKQKEMRISCWRCEWQMMSSISHPELTGLSTSQKIESDNKSSGVPSYGD